MTIRLLALSLSLVVGSVAAQAPPPDSLAARWSRALAADDLSAVEALIPWGAQPEMPGDPPLYLAARQGRSAVVERLLEAGADPTTRSPTRGTSALDAAIYFGHLDITQALLRAGADPQVRGPIGFAAMDWALESERPAMVAFIAERLQREATGAEATSYALVRAIVADDGDAVERLVQNGADPDASNGARYPPLSLAARLGRTAVIRRFLDAGANPDVGQVALDEASPLHQAARGGSPDAARLLLAAGADPNKLNARGFTPLHLAALYGRPAVASLLLQAGTDPAIRSVDPNPAIGEYTAFDFAIENNRPVVADTLLAWEARHAASPSSDHLAQAALRGDTTLLRRLLHSDASPNVPSTPGALPLALAARWGHREAVQILLDAGADPNGRSLGRYETTALMESTRDDRHDVARLLLGAGAQTTPRDRYGDTALTWAAAMGAASVASVLLDAGADRTVRGLTRETASEIATRNGFLVVARSIEAHPAESH